MGIRHPYQAELCQYYWPVHLDDAVVPVFLGASEAIADGGEEAKKAIVRLIRILARSLTEDANLYNSVKHGMAVVSGQVGFSLTDEQTGEGFGGQGPSLVFLESVDNNDHRTWRETTSWVNIRRTLWFTNLAIQQIELLWAIARFRYTDHEITGIHAITNEAIDLGLSGGMAGTHGMKTFSRVIGHELKTQAPPAKRNKRNPERPR